MKFLIKKILTLAIILSIPMVCLAQHQDRGLSSNLEEERAAFIGITAGISPSRFRDFATSPHIYEGIAGYLALTRLKVYFNKEFEWGISSSIGVHQMDFNEHTESSGRFTLSLWHSQLYPLKLIDSDIWDVKAGGLINVTGNVRFNEAFGNNGLGFEFFPTLFGSAKITRNISRTVGKEVKILFLKYRLNPINRNLSLRINPGLINSSFRNKFIYLQHSTAIDETKLLEDYKYKIFSGFRIGSAVDYTVIPNNKNAYQLSYLWDAYKTGGNLDKFEMAHHTVKLTLLFNTYYEKFPPAFPDYPIALADFM
jgi:hypothetical protein